MKKFDAEGLTDKEVIDNLIGREVEYLLDISDRESTAIIRSDSRIAPAIEKNDRGRVITFFSPEGRRWLQVENILRYGRKKF